MTDPVTEHRQDDPWTIEDLANMPANGSRYELFEGSLTVSPAPGLPHAHAVYRLRRRLEAQAPPHLAVLESVGVDLSVIRSYLIPDLIVVPVTALERQDPALRSLDPLLVVEVMSRGNSSVDLTLKRYAYSSAGIPQYWIVSKEDRTLTVLYGPKFGKGYVDSLVVRAGERFETDDPFPVSLDPAEFC